MLPPVFGANPAGARLARIRQSPHYRAGAFQNPEPTSVMRQDASYREMLGNFLRKPASVRPPRPLPSVRTDLRQLPADATSLVWFGHSSYLLRAAGLTFLVDPVFSGYASPFPVFGKAFAGADAYGVADLPEIDCLILSHDHYDHLDYRTFRQLLPKLKHAVVPLGVGAHLERWGLSAARLTELDWGESHRLAPGVTLTATPARHFSGRGFTRGKTLWASYVLALPGQQLFLGGDSGYGEHLRAIGEQYGPFDLAVLECGQYGRDWPNIHTFPEEVVQAAHDLGARLLLPVHWAKFALALHPWDEPIRRLLPVAAAAGLPVATPRIGEVLTLGQPLPQGRWWEAVNW